MYLLNFVFCSCRPDTILSLLQHIKMIYCKSYSRVCCFWTSQLEPGDSPGGGWNLCAQLFVLHKHEYIVSMSLFNQTLICTLDFKKQPAIKTVSRLIVSASAVVLIILLAWNELLLCTEYRWPLATFRWSWAMAPTGKRSPDSLRTLRPSSSCTTS